MLKFALTGKGGIEYVSVRNSNAVSVIVIRNSFYREPFVFLSLNRILDIHRITCVQQDLVPQKRPLWTLNGHTYQGISKK